jgi:hypothetical protein
MLRAARKARNGGGRVESALPDRERNRFGALYRRERFALVALVIRRPSS